MIIDKLPLDDNNNIIWDCKNVKVDNYMFLQTNHFNAVLCLKEKVKHNNKLKYVFENNDKTKQYEVFCEDLEDIIRHIENGKIAGTFEYVKHGQQYGIRLMHPSTK